MATPRISLRMKGQTTCIHHKGRRLELYGEKCQELVCLRCLSSIHKIHPVCELSEITPQKKQDIQNFIDRIEQNDLVQIGKYVTSIDTLLNDNDSTFEKLSQQLHNKMQIDKLKQDLDKLTAETLSLYQKMKDDNTKLLQKYKQELEILPVKPVLGTARFTPNKYPNGHLEKALGEVNTSGQSKIFTDQDWSVSTLDGQGQSSPQQNQSGNKGKKAVTGYKLPPDTKVVEEWESPCRITSICPSTDDQAWTSYYYNNKLTLIDRNGTLTQQITHNARIMDISLSPTTHRLWVCDRENNIMEFVSGQLKTRFKTKSEPRCIIVTASNHIIVGMSKHIPKFTTQGQVVLTTMSAGTGKPLVCTPCWITECPVTHNVAVIDFSDTRDGGDGNRHVVVIDRDFQKRFVYRGDIPSTYKQTTKTGGKQFNPRSVVYDSMGYLIIGDKDNYRVLLLGGGGEFLRIIHTDTVTIWVVDVDRKNVLWTVFGRNVKLLQYTGV